MICAECGQSFENEIDAVIQNHEPCATKHGTQPTALQQLKAEIANLVQEYDRCINEPHSDYHFSDTVNKLRQLSAV